jgi:hypothetical protein
MAHRATRTSSTATSSRSNERPARFHGRPRLNKRAQRRLIGLLVWLGSCGNCRISIIAPNSNALPDLWATRPAGCQSLFQLRCWSELGIPWRRIPLSPGGTGAAWMRRKSRALTRGFQIQARRGIKRSGLTVVGTGALAVAAYMFNWNIGFSGLSLAAFVLTSASHLYAVMTLDSHDPKPECPTCRLVLHIEGWHCSSCLKKYPATPPA